MIDPLPLDEAERLLHSEIEKQIDLLVRYAAPRGLKFHARQGAERDMKRERPDLAELLAKDDPLRKERGRYLASRRRVHLKTYQAAMLAAGWSMKPARPAHLVLAAQAALGKTRRAVELITKAIRAAPVPVQVAFLVDKHALGAGLIPDLVKVGMAYRVMLGRGQPNPSGPGKMCERANLAEKITAAGLSVRGTLCERQGSSCPHLATCAYFRQVEDVPPFLIGTHEAAVAGHLCGMKLDHCVVIMDESPTRALGGTARDGRVPDLRDLANDFPGRAETLHAVADVLERADLGGAGWQAMLERAGATRERITAAMELLKAGLPKTVGFPAEEGTIHWALNLPSMRQQVIDRSVVALLEAVLRDWPRRFADGTVTPLQSVHILAGDELKKKPEPEGRWFRASAPACLAADLAVLSLDASATAITTKAHFGEDSRFVPITVERTLIVVQITSPNPSHSRLGIGTNRTDGERQRGAPLRGANLEAVRLIARRHGRWKVGVIVPKELRELWTGEKNPSGITRWEEEGVLIGHHNAQRGLDDMVDCDAIAVIGRIQPPRQAIEGEARKVFAGDPVPLVGLLPHGEPDDGFTEFERQFHMADGRALETDIRAHLDPRVDALLQGAREQEVVQAIDRVRALRAAPGSWKVAYVFSDLVLPMKVDAVLPLEDWQAAVEMSLDRQGGPITLTRDGLRARAPGVLTSWQGKAVGEKQERNRADAFAAHMVAMAVQFRSYPEDRKSPIERYSLWEISGPTHAVGHVSDGHGKVKISIAHDAFPSNSREFSARIGFESGHPEIISGYPEHEQAGDLVLFGRMMDMANALAALADRKNSLPEQEYIGAVTDAQARFEAARDAWLPSMPAGHEARIRREYAARSLEALRQSVAIVVRQEWQNVKQAMDTLDPLITADLDGVLSLRPGAGASNSGVADASGKLIPSPTPGNAVNAARAVRDLHASLGLLLATGAGSLPVDEEFWDRPSLRLLAQHGLLVAESVEGGGVDPDGARRGATPTSVGLGG